MDHQAHKSSIASTHFQNMAEIIGTDNIKDTQRTTIPFKNIEIINDGQNTKISVSTN